MKKHRITSYCLLLLAGIVTTAALAMATGTTQARYTSIASSQLQLRQEKPLAVTLTSDVMAAGGQTVELGKLHISDSMNLTVNMKAEGGTASGVLFFENNAYLTGSCWDKINGSEAAFDVSLTPTEQARGLTDELTTTLRMYWDENLWADLRVTLVPNATGGSDYQAGTAKDGFLTGMEEFDPGALLAVQIRVPEGSDSVILSDLPKLTRYSTDGGANYTMLYYGGSAELKVRGKNMTVLLDLGATKLTDPLTLTAEVFSGEDSLGCAALTARPSVALTDFEDMASPLIVGKTALNMGLPTNMGGAELYYSLTRPDGTTENMPLIADENGSLVIDPMNDGVQAAAGTYLLDINWNYQGAIVATQQLTFYINYCSYVQPSSIPAANDSTEATTTGGNES